MFIQKISMDCTKEQYEKYLKEELLKMGYVEVGLSYWGGDNDYITNYFESEGTVGNINEEDIRTDDVTYLGEFNAELFLALAAMTDKPEGNYGEYIIGLSTSRLYRMDEGDRILPEHTYIRKATKEEIMAEFKPSQETFSVGDYITITTPRGHKLIGILSSRDVRRGDSGVQVFAGLNIAGILKLDTILGVQIPDKIRHSTEKEKEKLNQSLERTGQYFDLQELKIQSKKIITEMKIVFNVRRSELQKVHHVACPDWKERITEMVVKYGNPFSESISLPRDTVMTMFNAATPDQKEILSEVFPDYVEKIDPNPWRDLLTPGAMDRLDTLLREVNEIIMGETNGLLYVAKGLADNVPHLVGQAFAVHSSYDVKLHKGISGTTLIEFVRKTKP